MAKKKAKYLREAAEEVLKRHGIVPPDLDQEYIYVSTVLLGLEQRIATLEGGLAEIKRHVDGECQGITPADCLESIGELIRLLTEDKSNG